MKEQEVKLDIQKLLDIMARLRDPTGGCPWDREQTFETIAPYTLEEAYEVADAIARANMADLEDELGDLLLQVVYHARMAEEAGAFDFSRVVAKICAKLIRRHPHVFGDDTVESAAAQTRAWEDLKARERRPGGEGALDGVPLALPGLTRAVKLGRRAARLGFDWPELAGVREKVAEELAELDEAVGAGESEAVAAEMGDVLFTLANACRHLNLDPEACLRAANSRFEHRFRRVEAKVQASGGDWQAHGMDALEALWQEAKSD
jgi:MazG family protein